MITNTDLAYAAVLEERERIVQRVHLLNLKGI